MQGVVSFPELLAWFFYVTGNPEWLGWWQGTFGFYVSTIGMFFPWMFAIFQYAFTVPYGGVNMDMEVEFAYNAIFQLAMGIFQHLNSMYVHVFMGPRLMCYIKATEPIRRRTVIKKCPLKRTFGMTHDEYQANCKKLFALRAEAEPEASTAPSESSAW